MLRELIKLKNEEEAMSLGMRAVRKVALVAGCLCVFVPNVVAQECLELIGHLEISDYYDSHVATDGDYVYATTCGAFSVIDVRTPSAPVEVGSLETCAGSLVVSGEYAYVDRRSGPWVTGVQVIDISDPTSPFEVGFILWKGGIAAVSDGYAYTVDPEAGMWVIDVSDPASPIEVGFVANPGGREFRGVEVSESVAYATSTTLDSYPHSPRQFLDVIDMSDPSAPLVVGSTQVALEYIPQFWDDWVVNYSIGDVAVSGAYAFVSTTVVLCESHIAYTCRDFGGLSIVDVRDPAAPVVVAYMHTGYIRQFAVAGRLLFAAIFRMDSYGGDQFLRVIDIHDPSSPAYVGPSEYLGPDWEWIHAGAVCHCDRYLYTTGNVWDSATGLVYGGLQAFDTSACRTPYYRPPISEPQIE